MNNVNNVQSISDLIKSFHSDSESLDSNNENKTIYIIDTSALVKLEKLGIDRTILEDLASIVGQKISGNLKRIVKALLKQRFTDELYDLILSYITKTFKPNDNENPDIEHLKHLVRCPHCEEKFYLTIKTEFTAIKLLKKDDPNKINNISLLQNSKAFKNESIKDSTNVEIITSAPMQSGWRDSLSKQEAEILDLITKNGLSDAILKAITASKLIPVPAKNPERFILNFISLCYKKPLPLFVISYFKNIYTKAKKISCVSSQGIALILVDDVVKEIIPYDLVVPTGMPITRSRHTEESKQKENKAILEIDNWIKTKHGYVAAGSKIFLNEMVKKSIGEFANLSLSK